MDKILLLQTVQPKLLTPLVLAFLRSTGTYTLASNACDSQAGCILLQQQQERPDKPIGYWSISLDDAERAYDTTHGECPEVAWTVLLLWPYRESVRFQH